MDGKFVTMECKRSEYPDRIQYHIYTYRDPLDEGGSGMLEDLSFVYRTSEYKCFLELNTGLSHSWIVPELDDYDCRERYELPDRLMSDLNWERFSDWTDRAEGQEENLYLNSVSPHKLGNETIKRIMQAKPAILTWIDSVKQPR